MGGIMKSTVLVLVSCFALLCVTSPDESPAYPGGGMDTCTAAMIGYNIASYNLQTCLSIPGQTCYYETIARQYALSQAMYWCFGTQV